MINSFSKEILKLAVKPVLFLSILVLIVNFLSVVNYISVLLTILILLILFDTYKIIVPKCKSYAQTLLILSLFMVLFHFLGNFGLIGFILIVLLMSAYKIYRGRKIFMTTIRTVETSIWGAPLDAKEEDHADNEEENYI